MKNNAPIALFVYNRPKHTLNTLNALKSNQKALESELFIFSDGWKTEVDKKQVKEVRELLKMVDGFKAVHITESESNKGLAKSIIEGVTKVLQQFDRIIVLEDDLQTSPYFLEFMNAALDFYSPNHIWSIAGYTPPIKISSDYSYQTFLVNRNCSWGWATWKQNWEKTDWILSDFDSFIKNKKERKQFEEGGNDLSIMLLKQYTGIINSWSIRFNYSAYKAGLPNVYPTQSFIKNKGTDGSGTHVSSTSKYNTKLNTSNVKDVKFCSEKHFNIEITQNFKKFYNTSLYRRIINIYKIKKAGK